MDEGDSRNARIPQQRLHTGNTPPPTAINKSLKTSALPFHFREQYRVANFIGVAIPIVGIHAVGGNREREQIVGMLKQEPCFLGRFLAHRNVIYISKIVFYLLL